MNRLLKYTVASNSKDNRRVVSLTWEKYEHTYKGRYRVYLQIDSTINGVEHHSCSETIFKTRQQAKVEVERLLTIYGLKK